MTDMTGESGERKEIREPRQEQWEEFLVLTRELTFSALDPLILDSEDENIGISTSTKYDLDEKTVVDVGHNCAVLWIVDAVHMELKKRLDLSSPGLEQFDVTTIAFSPSTESTYFRNEIETYRDGHRIRSEQQWRIIEMIGQNTLDETIDLISDPEKLAESDSELAQAIRENDEMLALGERLSYERMEELLVILRTLNKAPAAYERISIAAIRRMMPAMFADMIEDKHVDGNENKPDV